MGINLKFRAYIVFIIIFSNCYFNSLPPPHTRLEEVEIIEIIYSSEVRFNNYNKIRNSIG